MQLAQYKGAQGILLGVLIWTLNTSANTDLIVSEVYDASCRQSFVELTRWFAEISTYVHGPVVKVIVGNKVDKVRRLSRSTLVLSCLVFVSFQEYQRQVPTAEAAAFAEKMGCYFVETSAKSAVGVRKAFRDIVERIVENPELRVIFKPSPPQASFARPRPPHFLSY